MCRNVVMFSEKTRVKITRVKLPKTNCIIDSKSM